MIVHAVLALDLGGLERLVVALARHRHERGQPVAVLCLERLGPLADELKALGVPVHCFDEPPGRHKSLEIKAESLLRELGAAVLHTHQIAAAWHLAPAAKKLGLRVVHTEHGNPFARASSSLEALKLRWLFRSVAKSVDAFAAVSPEIAESLARGRTVPRKKIRLVPNGIAPLEASMTRDAARASFGIPASAFVVGTVGRLNEVKRQDILLRAFAKLDDAWLLLAGDGPERAALEKLASDLNVRDRVVFAGFQSNVADCYAAMDVFALTSRSEGFPVSLLEAWSMKLPVVVSAVGGLPQIVSQERTGLLVPFGEPVAFTAALARLRDDAALARSPGDAAFARSLGEAGCDEFLRGYTLDRMAANCDALYGGAAS